MGFDELLHDESNENNQALSELLKISMKPLPLKEAPGDCLEVPFAKGWCAGIAEHLYIA